MDKEQEEKLKALEEKVRALEGGMEEFMKEFDISDKRMKEQLMEQLSDRRAVAEILKGIIGTDKVENVPPNVLGEEEGQILISKCREMMRAALPETFKIGRQGFFRLRSAGRIFGIDKKKLAEANVTEVDFMAFTIAMYKALSNQSYVSGNQDTHSGVSREKAEKATKLQKSEADQKALEKAAIIAYTGDVVVSLPELCKDGYGDTKATTLHKKTMKNIINFLDSTPITVHYASGDLQGTYICKKMSFYTEKKNGTTFYELHLNPAYTENVARNFGELPQDAMRRLAACTKKLTAPHMRLMLRLSLQGKKKPFTRTLEELLEEIGVDKNTYKINSARVEGQVIELCDTMVRAGAAESYEPTYTTSARGRKQLRKVTFYPVKDRGEETPKG